MKAEAIPTTCPACRAGMIALSANEWKCQRCGAVIAVPTDEMDREDRAARDVLEVWPQLRPALDVLADPDADLFSAAFTKALAQVRRCLAALDGKDPT